MRGYAQLCAGQPLQPLPLPLLPLLPLCLLCANSSFDAMFMHYARSMREAPAPATRGIPKSDVHFLNTRVDATKRETATYR